MPEENDDLLNQDGIDELLNSGGSPEASEGSGGEADTGQGSEASESPAGESADATQAGPAPDAGGQAEPEAPSGETEDATSTSNPEELLNQAEADLARAVSSDLDGPESGQGAASQAQPFEFPEFGGATAGDEEQLKLNTLQDVELDLRIELGRTDLMIDDVLKLKHGSVVPLNKLAGDPVDILVNGRLIARGEVLVLNDNFCVRVAEILTPDS